MLQKIRSNIQGVMARIIIGLITIPFLLWGVDAFFLDSGDPDVAEVNGKTISEWELKRQVYRQRQQILARGGEDIDPSQIDETRLRGPVLQGLIQQRLLEQAAESRNFYISEGMIDAIILQQPDFQVEGRFSPARFEALVRSNSMSPADYKIAMKNQLLVNQLLSGFGSTEFVTPSELKFAVQLSGQERDIDYVLLSLDDAREQVSVETAVVREYFDAHPDEFMTEEQVELEYIELTLAGFYPDLEESDIEAAYAAEIADATATTRRRAAHILLEVGEQRTAEEAQAQLAELAGRIQEGGEFAALALEFSEDIGSREMGGDLGYSDGNAFPEAFELSLAELQVGEVSAPLETGAGWHLVTLVELQKSEPPTFEARREAITQQLKLSKAEPLYAVKLEELKDISFNAPDLQSVATELDLDAKKSDFLNRDGADQGLFADQRLVAEAFTTTVLEDGANSEVVEISETQAVVLRIMQRVAPQPVPYGEVEEAILGRLREDGARELVQQRAEKLMEAVRSGNSLATSAEAEGVEYKSYTALSREKLGDASPGVVAAAFQMSPPADAPNVAIKSLPDGSTAVIALVKVVPGSLTDIEEDHRRNLQQLLGRFRSEQAVAGFRATLQESADIELL